LFCSWIILNTVNPDLLKLKPLETMVINKSIFGSCCWYKTEQTAKDLEPKRDCDKKGGTFYEKGKSVIWLKSNVAGGKDKSFCADTGCCRCNVGGSWKTLWFSDSNCIDEKNGGGKVLPDTCELACKLAGEAMNLPADEEFRWGQECGTDGECVPAPPSGNGTW
jgi:hypothetical protein